MSGNMSTRPLSYLLALLLASTTMLAQARRISNFPHSPKVTPVESPSAPRTIFSNFGPTRTNAYDDTTGFFVAGPNGLLGQAQWVGGAFRPKTNATVKQLQVPIGYVAGTKGIIVGLYSDASGNVGTALQTVATTNIPDFGTCCQTVTVSIPPTAVVKGTQYWVVVTSDDVNAPDFTGIWADSNLPVAATNVSEAGWSAFKSGWSAFVVSGTVP